jgi:hypothetical protein
MCVCVCVFVYRNLESEKLFSTHASKKKEEKKEGKEDCKLAAFGYKYRLQRTHAFTNSTPQPSSSSIDNRLQEGGMQTKKAFVTERIRIGIWKCGCGLEM